MDPAVAQGFLSLAQSLSARAPFLLVMAGASRMKHMIKEADVSCRARAVKLPIGRLSEKESEDAAAKPFDAAGFAITPGALKAVVAEPQRHPLFIQDWETCFRQLKKSRDMKEIILDAVDRAWERMKGKRRRCYEECIGPLRGAHSRAAIKSLATAFGARKACLPMWSATSSPAPFLAPRTGAFESSASAAAVCCILPSGDFAPAIPGLMDHVARTRGGRGSRPARRRETPPP